MSSTQKVENPLLDKHMEKLAVLAVNLTGRAA